MSRIAKDDLEKLTEETIKMSLLNLVLLGATKCPITELFEMNNDLLDRTENLRKALGLKELLTNDIVGSFVSVAIKEDLRSAFEEVHNDRQSRKLGGENSFTAAPDKHAN
jgi:hypothetical protein